MSGKIDEYEYLAGEEVLPYDQKREKEQAMFPYSPLEKGFEKRFPKSMRTNEIENEIYETKKWEEKIKQKDLKYEAGKHKYDFKQYETIRCFGESIYFGKINIRKAEIDQTNLLEKGLPANIKLSKIQLHKIGQSGGFLSRFLRPLLKTGLYLNH